MIRKKLIELKQQLPTWFECLQLLATFCVPVRDVHRACGSGPPALMSNMAWVYGGRAADKSFKRRPRLNILGIKFSFLASTSKR